MGPASDTPAPRGHNFYLITPQVYLAVSPMSNFAALLYSKRVHVYGTLSSARGGETRPIVRAPRQGGRFSNVILAVVTLENPSLIVALGYFKGERLQGCYTLIL